MDDQQNVNMGKVPSTSNGGSAGPIIAVIVILAIVILGGLYFWGQRGEEVMNTGNNDTNLDSQSQSQSQIDDLNSIEADLDATDIENLDAEINAS